jgi:hypothetical protein
MELLRETCADKSRVINTQCVKPIAEMCSSQVQEIKKECAKGIVGSEELTLNKALDSASAAAQQCAAQASSLLKSCMKQSKTLSPDLKELAMIDSKAEERAKEIKKEKEIQDKVNESMKDLSFSSSSSTLAQKEEEVVTMPQPGEQVEVVAASKPVIVARHHSSSLSKMKLPVVTEDVEEVEPAATTVSTTTPTATVQTLSVPQPVLTTAAADATATTTNRQQHQHPEEEEEEEKEQQQQPDSSMTSMAKDYLSQSGSSHERTIMLTEAGRKSLVLDVLKNNQKNKNQFESEEEEVEEDDGDLDQVETKESVEEEIAFNFSPPDEQTVSLSEEMRKSLAQTLARQEEPVNEFSTGTGEFTFTNPESIALSPPEEILSYENDELEKKEEEEER